MGVIDQTKLKARYTFLHVKSFAVLCSSAANEFYHLNAPNLLVQGELFFLYQLTNQKHVSIKLDMYANVQPSLDFHLTSTEMFWEKIHCN